MLHGHNLALWEANKAGWRAFVMGNAAHGSPYRKGSKLAAEWEAGRFAAARCDPALVAYLTL